MAADPHPTAADGVWITRAEPAAAATARRVAALGFTPVVAPLLRFAPVAAELTLQPGEALAFTSINGVTRAAALSPWRDRRVFAVGDATAEAARAAGFVDVTSAGGDVGDLSTLINQAALLGGVVHPCAVETAGDLVGDLNAAGVRARKVAVYETLAAKTLPTGVAGALNAGRLAAILIHSPKAGRIAAALLSPYEAELRTVAALGLSPACVDPLRDLNFRACLSARQATEAALSGVLESLARRRPGDE